MKTLQVYKDYFPVRGGIENHIRLLARGLVQSGIDSEVLVAGPKPYSAVKRMDGIRVTKAGRFATLASTPISPAIFTHLSRSNADLIHLHFPYPIGEMAYLAGGHGRPLIITYHSDIVRQQRLLRFYRPFLEQAIERAGRVIVSTPQLAASSEFLAKCQDKVRVIPFGIDLDRFAQPDLEAVARIRARFDRPIALFAGKLRYYKGLEYLIEAMKQVDAELVIVGSGPMENELKEQARRLPDKVHFAGEVSDGELINYYHASDVFVLPSSYPSETFGIVQIEAMAAGKPVISTELGTGTSWVNRDGETGLVVPRRDSPALADAINTLLQDSGLRKRLGAAAMERARQEFGADTMVRRVIEVYREIVQK